MSDAAENNRVYWHSRRGMLELDLVLMPFAQRDYPLLERELQRQYRELLEREDAELFAWLVRGVPCDEPGLAAMVRRILAHGSDGRADDPH